MLKYLTAGESHGKANVSILEGMPANLVISASDIDIELARRQSGYGRGGRQKIEKDKVEILSGIRLGKTLGSPIALLVNNRDWENWQKIMPIENDKGVYQEPVTKLRPGHADLPGVIKYDQTDIRNILERASARSTVGLVAVGAIAKKLLNGFGIQIFSHVTQVGNITADVSSDLRALHNEAEKSDLRCADAGAAEKMRKLIDKVKADGDSIGGVFEIIITGVPVGLGTHVHNDRKLSTRLAAAVAGIQSVKGVEFGLGFGVAVLPGSNAHDEIYFDNGKFIRKTNRAGGLEGGMSNGEPLIIRAAVKPIATIEKALRSIDLVTKEAVKAHIERADTCHVPATGVIAEAACAIEVANAFLEKFGGDSIGEIAKRYSL